MKEVIGHKPAFVKDFEEFKLYLETPYFKEFACSENCYFLNTKTKERFDRYFRLFIRCYNENGELLPEEEWTYDTTDDVVMVTEWGDHIAIE